METYWTMIPPMTSGPETNPNKTASPSNFTTTIRGIFTKRKPPTSASEHDIDDAASYISHRGLRRHLSNLRVLPYRCWLALSSNYHRVVVWYKQRQVNKRRKSYIPPPSFFQRLGWVRNDSACLFWSGKERVRELCRAGWERVRVWWWRRRGEMKVSGKDWRERGIAGVIEVLLAVNNLGGVWKKLRHIAVRTKFRVIRLTINLLLAINATIQITRKAWLSSGSWIKSILIRSIISILLLVNRTIQWITLKTISANAICTSLNQKIYNNGRPYVLAGVIYFLMTIQAVITFFQKFTPEEPRITRPLSIVESSFPTSTGSVGAASPRSMTSAFFASTTNILASSASSIKEVVMRPRMLLPMYKDTDSGGRKHTNSTYNMWMVFITSQRLEKLVAPGEGAGTRGGTVGGGPRAGALV